MRILDIVKPDLRDIRNQIARDIRAIRKTDPDQARRRLKRFQAGMAATEAALNYNLMHGSSGGGLANLLGLDGKTD